MTGIGDASRPRTPPELDALLDGGTSGDARLDGMVVAARRPGRVQELGAGPPVLPADSTAPLRSGERSRGPARTRRVLARLSAATLLTKAVTAAAGAAVIGAAAVAGATGHLPGQTRHHTPAVTPSGTSTSSTSTRTGPRTGAPSSGASNSATRSGASSSAPTTSASPAPGAAELPALCVQWLALLPGSAAAAHDPRFRLLIQAAGGVQAVTAFCRSLPSSAGGPTGSQGLPVTESPTAPTRPATTVPRAPTETAPDVPLTSATSVTAVTHAIPGH